MNTSNDLRIQGTVMTECVMALPLVLFLLSGLVDISRTLNELTWASNSAYQLASVLGGNQKSRAKELMADRWLQISRHYRQREFSKAGLSVDAAQPAAGFAADFSHPAAKVVGVSVSASIKPLGITPFAFPITVRAVAPYLIQDVDTSLFSHPSNEEHFDCRGVKCTPGVDCPACCDHSDPSYPQNIAKQADCFSEFPV